MGGGRTSDMKCKSSTYVHTNESARVGFFARSELDEHGRGCTMVIYGKQAASRLPQVLMMSTAVENSGKL